VGAIALGLASCFGGGPRLLAPQDAGVAAPVEFGDAGDLIIKADVDLGDSFAILGLTPGHGPWSGGTRTIIRGRGFTSSVDITVGGKPVDPTSIVASDPTRIAIVTPEGIPGPADVTVRNRATADQRTLPNGFVYDAFVVKPDAGPQTGGTRVRIEGKGTAFAAGTTVNFGADPCTELTVTSPTEIECTTPPGAIGPVEVVAKAPGAADLSARDAFTYTDLSNPARGGFSGGVLSGSLRVDVHDGATGLPVPGAKVIAGESLASAIVGTTGASGSVTLTGSALTSKVTVTASAKCHQPVTFVDVPMDTVSVYLSPVIDLSCAELGDPPSSGGRGFRNGASVDGQLVWEGGVEFKRAGWRTVPQPVRQTERQAAYVFVANGSLEPQFYLPSATSATTPNSEGTSGYRYTLVLPPGNVTLYALAGIEDRSVSPPLFSVYAMGVARGVAVTPNQPLTDVDIIMNVIVDRQLEVTSQPPPVTSRGPDRLFSTLAISLGPNAYAWLPTSSQTHLLPFPGVIDFAPVPSLDGALATEAYIVGATAATSPSRSAPASVVSRVRITDANAPVSLGGFLTVPTMIEPAAGAFSGTNVEFGASGTYDISQTVISAGGGLTSWTIVAPAGRTHFGLPDLATFPDSIGLKHGPISTTVTVARLEAGFSYEKLQSDNLASSRWTAQAWDTLSGSY
jgi:hypothetical protein